MEELAPPWARRGDRGRTMCRSRLGRREGPRTGPLDTDGRPLLRSISIVR